MRSSNIIKRGLLMLFFFTFVIASANAQEDRKHAFYIDFDTKVIYVDSLRISNSTSALRIISILPELLNRPKTSYISNYDIKLNGLSLGNSADAAIMQLQLADIEKIEISESSTSSYLNNGQGGSINFILRKKPYDYKGLSSKRENRDFWGSANIGALYHPTVLPSVRLNWRDKNWHIHTMASGCMANLSSDNSTITPTYVSNQTIDNRTRYQFVCGYMNLTLTPKDIFEFKLSERYSHIRESQYATIVEANKSEDFNHMVDTAKAFEAHALVNYKHLFRKFTYETEFQYAYNNSNSSSIHEDIYNSTVKRNTNLSGTMKFTGDVFKGPGKNYGKLRLAVDMNYTFINDDWGLAYKSTGSTLTSSGHTFFVMPYIKWECRFNKTLLMAQAEYQHFKNEIDFLNDQYSNASNDDFTGMFVMEQQIGVPHHLRLMLTRKIQRPTYVQAGPFIVFVPNEDRYVIGNTSLTSTLVHELSFDYISRYYWGPNALTIDLGANYYRVDNLISAQRKDAAVIKNPDDHPIYMYENSGMQNIVNGNLMVFYSRNNFSVSAAANVYNSGMKKEGVTKHHTYYNISLMPSFELPDGWSCTLYGAYHSKIVSTGSEQGSVALTQLNVGRSFGRWHVNFYQKSAFTGKCEDVTFSNKGDILKKYDAVTSEIGFGLRYLF